MYSILCFIAVISASDSGTDLQEVFRKVWSPYCKGVSLLECSSSKAQDLRDELRSRAENGESADQILNDLESRYGDRLRMMPDRGGRENLAWQIPWIFTAIVLMSLGIWIYRRRRAFFQRPDATESHIASKTQEKRNPDQYEKILRDLNDRL